MIFSSPAPPPKAPIVTVWVHGTKINECLPSFLEKATKCISETFLEHRQGLLGASDLDPQHYSFLRLKALTDSNAVLFNPNHFYIFGWPGKLNLEVRKKASHDLFYALKTLSITYRKKYNCDPQFILISHSHGGNVILHLADIIDAEGFQLHISKAILLACPVQKHTAHLINSPIFDRIYSLHSHTDMIQIADMQGLHNKKKSINPLFSKRHFDIHPKLIQASVRWKKCPLWIYEDYTNDKIIIKRLIKAINTLNHIKKNRGLLHTEFQLLPFIRQLPVIIDQLDKLLEANNYKPLNKNDDIIIEL